MDQGPLVMEQIDAGVKLAEKFAAYAPLQSVFWLKEPDDGQWFLYLASEQIDDTNFDIAYGEVLRILGKGPHLWLDPFQVKVTGADDPVARAVFELRNNYSNRLPTRLRNCKLGGLRVEEAFIYEIPHAVSSGP